jgi:hypothetical protein
MRWEAMGCRPRLDVYRVGAGDVADGRVGIDFFDSGLRRGEGVGQRGAKRDEGDGGDGGQQAHAAAHVRGEVADERREAANADQRDTKAQPAAREPRRRHKSKDELRETNRPSATRPVRGVHVHEWQRGAAGASARANTHFQRRRRTRRAVVGLFGAGLADALSTGG